MNVHFPGFDSGWAFWTIVGVMLATALGLIAFFRSKRWI
jgi:LPXTG-motif cell wall-anchored protein